MKRSKVASSLLALISVFALAAGAMPSSPAGASSHREAPLISGDPAADVTDVYAFRSPDAPSTVTIVSNWIPLQQPAGGPNFYKFDDSVLYTINVDTTGDGDEELRYEFKFRTAIQNPNTFLYNTGPITSLTDPDYNIRQSYDVTRVTRSLASERRERREVIAKNVPVPPDNIGPRSTPNYDALAAAAIKPLMGGGQVFAGQRDDAFFVDLGSVFDLAGLRPFNSLHLIPLPAAPGVDGVAGYNVHTISMQLPISSFGASNGAIGVWAAAKRNKTRVIENDGVVKHNGPLRQVSRLGMPLVNEVLIALDDKDKWNSSDPSDDAEFDPYILQPEPAALENLLYPALTDTETSNRQDLLAVFHTGVPGLNTLPDTTHADMLRLNMNIAPSAVENRLGVLRGDFAGFPNGRRLRDDVVDIELQALACAYGAAADLVFSLTGNCDPAVYNGSPNGLVGDGVDANDKPLLSSFPYQATPFQGYEAMPPTVPDGAKAALGALGAASLAPIGLGLLFVYRRKKSEIRK
jgi:hypothetical protein